MSAHVDVVLNRRARRIAADARVVDQCRGRATVRVLETSSLADLDAAAAEIASQPRDTVVVLAGGDGSYSAGVSALEKYFGERPLPRLALVPGGTVNIVAKNWGMRGDAASSLASVLDAIASDEVETTRRPTLALQDLTRRLGFIAGAGLVARFFEVYDARGARGNGDAARIVARIFTGSFFGAPLARKILEPSRCELLVDGTPAPFDRLSLFCASVVRDLGLGMRLLYRAGEELDRFHAVATPLGARLLGPQMPLVLAGRPLLGPRVDTLARTFRLRFPPGEGAYVLDGDLVRADVVDVSAGPPIDVVTPRVG